MCRIDSGRDIGMLFVAGHLPAQGIIGMAAPVVIQIAVGNGRTAEKITEFIDQADAEGELLVGETVVERTEPGRYGRAEILQVVDRSGGTGQLVVVFTGRPPEITARCSGFSPRAGRARTRRWAS